MSAITSLTGPSNPTSIPLVTPQPQTPTPVATTVPVSPTGVSATPPLTAAQTLYDTTVQGDVDPSSLLPPDFDVEAWAPSLYANAGYYGAEMEENDCCYADEYRIQPWSPSYYATQKGYPLRDWGEDGEFEILPWGYGTGPKSYYARPAKPTTPKFLLLFGVAGAI